MNSSESDDQLVQEYAEAFLEKHIPVIIYDIIVNLCGIVGNIATMIYYGRSAWARRTPTHLLLAAISLNDLITSMCIGDIIGIIFLPTGFSKEPLICQWFFVLLKSFVINSLMILVLIGFDRYFRVCRPFSKLNFTLKRAKYCLIALPFVSFLFSSRSFAIFDIIQKNMTFGENKTIIIDHCSPSDTIDNHQFFIASQIIDMISLIAVVIILIVLYTLIWRKVVKQRQITRSESIKAVKQPHYVDIKSNSVSSADNTLETKLDSDRKADENKEVPMDESINPNIMPTNREIMASHSNAKANKRDKKNIKTPKRSDHTNKITFTMFMMTTASLLSFLPFLIAVAVFPKDKEKSAAVKIVFRSFMLNSSINPYTIGLIDRGFRQFLRQGISKCCHWRR